MINPEDGTQAIRTALSRIPEVVNLVGDPDRIIAYSAQGSSLEAFIQDMEDKQLVVAYEATTLGEGDGFNYWIHIYTIYIRLSAVPLGTVFASVVNGVPSPGDGLPFLNTDLLSNMEQLGTPSMERVLDADDVEYGRITMQLRQQTGD